MAGPVWMKEKLFLMRADSRRARRLQGRSAVRRTPRVARGQRVLSVAFREAAILTIDGVGEWATAVGRGSGQRDDTREELHFPDSLGLLYSAFTYFTGFKVNSGEYKVMGLAPYGEPVYVRRSYES